MPAQRSDDTGPAMVSPVKTRSALLPMRPPPVSETVSSPGRPLLRLTVHIATVILVLGFIATVLVMPRPVVAPSVLASALDELLLLVGMSETELKNRGASCVFSLSAYSGGYSHCSFAPPDAALRRVQLSSYRGHIVQMNVWFAGGTSVGDLEVIWGSPVVRGRSPDGRYAIMWPQVRAEALTQSPGGHLSRHAPITVVTITEP